MRDRLAHVAYVLLRYRRKYHHYRRDSTMTERYSADVSPTPRGRAGGPFVSPAREHWGLVDIETDRFVSKHFSIIQVSSML